MTRDQHRKTDSKLAKVTKATVSKTQFIDGLDEITHFFRGILPEGTESFATSAAFSLFIIPIGLAIVHSVDEFNESSKELEGILKEKGKIKKTLENLMNFSDKNRQLLAKQLGIKLEKNDRSDRIRQQLKDAKSPLEMARHMQKYQDLNNQQIVAELNRNGSLLEIGALASLGVGAIGAIASGVEGIKSTLSSVESAAVTAETAATTAEITAGSFFMFGQVLMSIYAGYRWHKGEKIDKSLQDKLETFNHNNDNLDQSTINHINQIVKKQRDFIYQHSIKYGRLMMFGQATALAGTACGLSGIGAIATAPLIGVAMATSAYPAFNKIYYQKKEDNFVGKRILKSGYVKNILKKNEPMQLLLENIEKEKSGTEKTSKKELSAYDKTLDHLQTNFKASSKALAAEKLLSLMHKIVNNKKYQKLNAEQKIEVLDNIFQNGKIKKSGLEGQIVNLTQSFFNKNRMEIRKFFSRKDVMLSDKNDILKNASFDILQSLQDGKEFDFASSLTEPEVTGHQKDNLAKSLKAKLEGKNPKDAASKTISKAKQACKALRFQLAQRIIYTTCCKKTYLDLKGKTQSGEIEDADDLSISPPPQTHPTASQGLSASEIAKNAALAAINAKLIKGTELTDEEKQRKREFDETVNKNHSSSKKFLNPDKYSGIGVICEANFDFPKKCYVFKIIKIIEGSPAEKKGLVIGDQIIVKNEQDLKEATIKMREFEDQNVEILRNGKVLEIEKKEIKSAIFERPTGNSYKLLEGSQQQATIARYSGSF